MSARAGRYGAAASSTYPASSGRSGAARSVAGPAAATSHGGARELSLDALIPTISLDDILSGNALPRDLDDSDDVMGLDGGAGARAGAGGGGRASPPPRRRVPGVQAVARKGQRPSERARPQSASQLKLEPSPGPPSQGRATPAQAAASAKTAAAAPEAAAAASKPSRQASTSSTAPPPPPPSAPRSIAAEAAAPAAAREPGAGAPSDAQRGFASLPAPSRSAQGPSLAPPPPRPAARTAPARSRRSTKVYEAAPEPAEPLRRPQATDAALPSPPPPPLPSSETPAREPAAERPAAASLSLSLERLTARAMAAPPLPPPADAGFLAALRAGPAGAEAAGPVIRSTRAPRSQRLRSTEWTVAAAAVAAAQAAAREAAERAAKAAADDFRSYLGPDWEPPPLEQTRPSPRARSSPPKARRSGWRGEVDPEEVEELWATGAAALQGRPPALQPQLQPQRQAAGREAWAGPGVKEGDGSVPAYLTAGAAAAAGGGELELVRESYAGVLDTELRDVIVLTEAPLRQAIAAAAAEQRGLTAAQAAALTPEALPAAVDRHNWRLHAAVLFPDVYDADWHECLFDFLFALWPQVGRAHVTAGGATTSSRRLLLTSDAEFNQALAAQAANGADGGGSGGGGGGVPRRQQAAAAALLDAAYGFAAKCTASADFAISSALAISVLDCMDDHDELPYGLAARLPPALVARIVTPLVPRFQPSWVVDEWREAVANTVPTADLSITTVPGRWLELVEALEQAKVLHPECGLGVLHMVLGVEEGEGGRAFYGQLPPPPPPPQQQQQGMADEEERAQGKGKARGRGRGRRGTEQAAGQEQGQWGESSAEEEGRPAEEVVVQRKRGRPRGSGRRTEAPAAEEAEASRKGSGMALGDEAVVMGAGEAGGERRGGRRTGTRGRKTQAAQ
ncbi:hypothetical protein HYH03_010791 [Edaphochlamys debaryana]|uniref:Uncharacterized protein n=1 Tax=Edaphochlamys debaryana TaxID=47281 RepID=A0A836BX63_9CHLO|nr:hypothetical protein HYH03_010791 [Edaphochlamys debaryana]|eukprot:KAG2490873.1 hypothetical protein HYH03_010791 [Edaphochlamys debaryana]